MASIAAMADTAIPILVVEDEAAIRRGLLDCLSFHGYAPTGVEDGPRGLEEALSGRYRLVLLDVMLPGLDGFSICRRLRAYSATVGILLLTAKGSEADVLQGFQLGADDYVCKPFSVAQLMMRVQALLRRQEAHSVPVAAGEVQLGAVVVSSERLEASESGRMVPLTRRDCEILHLLASRSGRIVHRQELLKEVWGYACPDQVQTRAVDMHLVTLRRKLARLPSGDGLIETVRGEGFRMSARSASAAARTGVGPS